MSTNARGIGAEGRDPQGLGAEPAEPGPQGAPKNEQRATNMDSGSDQ